MSPSEILAPSYNRFRVSLVVDKSSHSWRIHLGLFIAESICVSAFVIEMSRALSGNALSWAYVVEWPVLGVYAIYMWKKLLKDEPHATPSSSPHGEDDEKLRAWNEYLRELHQSDQSGPARPHSN